MPGAGPDSGCSQHLLYIGYEREGTGRTRQYLEGRSGESLLCAEVFGRLG